MPRRTTSSWPGPRPCRSACAIRSITGPTWSFAATSASTSCSTSGARRRSGRRANEQLQSDELTRARHPAQVRRPGGVHHRRSGRSARSSRRDRGFGAGDQGLPDLPSRSGAAGGRSRDLQSLGRAARRDGAGADRQLRRFRAGAAPAAPGLSRRGRPTVRPRPGVLPRGRVLGRRGGRDLRSGARRTPGDAGRARAVRVVPDAAVRPPRCREGVDQAAAPRRPPQRQHAHAPDPRPRHRLRLDRRLSPGRRPGLVPRSARAGERAAEDDPLQQQSRTTTTRWRR